MFHRHTVWFEVERIARILCEYRWPAREHDGARAFFTVFISEKPPKFATKPVLEFLPCLWFDTVRKLNWVWLLLKLCKNVWLHVIAMGTNKLNNHGDLKDRSLGWFIHIVTHICIYMDVHLYPSGQQCQNHHHCVWGYVLACAHACKCVHMDLGVNLRCHSLGVFCLTFWGRVSYWDLGFIKLAVW